jgi:hypothetical protein
MRTKPGHVFINCPFDAEYEQLFHALLFTVSACGGVPRCALEEDDAMQIRLHKIVRIIEECPLGIHDVSRTELDEANGLPRFNMPFELGIFIGASSILRRRCLRRALILDSDPYRYQKFLSDIAGQDIRSHGGDSARVIRVVRDWLAAASPDASLPPARKISRAFQAFKASMPDIAVGLGFHHSHMPFVDLKKAIVSWIKASHSFTTSP